MIAAVSNRGLMRFKLYKGALNVAIFIDFMERLLKDAKQKVFLIVDNLRVHHAKAVQDWLARHKVEIEIFYLPAYAPEHNPDEYLNNDLKQTIKNKPRAKTRNDLRTLFKHMRLRCDGTGVLSIFRSLASYEAAASGGLKSTSTQTDTFVSRRPIQWIAAPYILLDQTSDNCHSSLALSTGRHQNQMSLSLLCFEPLLSHKF